MKVSNPTLQVYDTSALRILMQMWNLQPGLSDSGIVVQNDHIAFRTLDLNPISISDLEPLLINLGYAPFDDYTFEDKKLNARSVPTISR